MKTYLLHVTFEPQFRMVDTVLLYPTIEMGSHYYTAYLSKFRPDILRASLEEFDDEEYTYRKLAFYVKCLPDD